MIMLTLPPRSCDGIAWRSIGADVFITAELRRRAPTKTDYLQEKLALQDLTRQMADHPGDVLPRLGDLAMQICGSNSGGIIY